MMINDVSFVNASYAKGHKLYVPVSPLSVVYAQFDHVSGVAAKVGQQGVSVSKAKILNTLIDQLSTMKSFNKNSLLEGAAKATDAQLDALIEDYQAQIKTSLDDAKTFVPYQLQGLSIPQDTTGVMFMLTA